jgi:hypothetical protein
MNTVNSPKILLGLIPLIAILFVSYLVYASMNFDVEKHLYETFSNLQNDTENNITSITNIHPSQFSSRGVGEYNGVFSKGNINITGPISGNNTTFIS